MGETSEQNYDGSETWTMQLNSDELASRRAQPSRKHMKGTQLFADAKNTNKEGNNQNQTEKHNM